MRKKTKFITYKWKVALSFVMLIAFGCSEDILDQDNPNKITPLTFWQTAEDAKAAIFGAYSPITGAQSYGRVIVFTTDYRDDILNPFSFSERTAAAVFRGDSTTGLLGAFWRETWKVIVRSNEVLFRVPDIEDPNLTQEKRNSILGEALFLRAFSYLDLLNTYRNVPLVTIPLSLNEANTVSQAPPEQVYAQIIADLQEARNLLPMTRESDDVGRATWAAASGILARAYLVEGDYASALPILREIIDSNLFSLTDDYFDNFRRGTENNSESVFEWQFVNDGGNQWAGDVATTARTNSIIPDYAPKGFTNQNGTRVNQWALDLFLDEQTINGEIDPRTFATFFWDTDETTTYEGRELSSMTYSNQTYQEARPGDTFIYGNKYVLDDVEQGETQSTFFKSPCNWRLIRYSEILLSFAEASMMLNSGTATQEGVDAVNLVRVRSDMPAFDLSMTFEDLQDERIKELALEHIRWNDLLRWGMIKERIVDIPGIKSEAGGTGSYQPGREYIDLPERELNLNPNFNSNPGY